LHTGSTPALTTKRIKVMEDKQCPNCGEKENLHPNYDYSKPNTPIQDVLCNECGRIFEIPS
jgi:DNA-directed RNA polymerase subunit RPC12/RpoP